MYPTIVIMLVESQRSMADICGISISDSRVTVKEVSLSGPRAATLGHLSFAVEQSESATESVSHSQWSRALQVGPGQDVWKAD